MRANAHWTDLYYNDKADKLLEGTMYSGDMWDQLERLDIDHIRMHAAEIMGCQQSVLAVV